MALVLSLARRDICLDMDEWVKQWYSKMENLGWTEI